MRHKTEEEIAKLTDEILNDIGINNVPEGDLRCRANRITAAQSLSKIISQHVLARDPIAYPSKWAAPLFLFVEQVALRGDIGMGETTETRNAIGFVIRKMIETYGLPDEDRKRIYQEALLILVTTHPLLDENL